MTDIKTYIPLPTLRAFHECPAQNRAIVGPVGSGKTSAATLECGLYLPQFLYDQYKIKRSRWAIIRNSYPELRDTTMKTVKEWFPDVVHKIQTSEMHFTLPGGLRVEFLFRSCDRPEDVKKFKSLELTGAWIDESIEVKSEVLLMLKNRVGRFPPKCPVKWCIETTNPPDIEHPLYSNYVWTTPPPGPVPEGEPLENHVGFWQPPGENDSNLRPMYYADLRHDYRNNPDWIDMYIDGKPGLMATGRLVFNNFKRSNHVSHGTLKWNNGPLYRGWDNSGNCPAAVVVQCPTAGSIQVLREYCTDKMGIVDFTRWVVADCELRWPGASYTDYADPAGENQYSTKSGDFTSNAELQLQECRVQTIASEQNWTARKEAVETSLRLIDGLLIDPSCHRLVNGFIAGYTYPEIGGTGIFRDKPLKNRFSHPHDALQYVLVKLTRPTYAKAENPIYWEGRQQYADGDYNELEVGR